MSEPSPPHLALHGTRLLRLLADLAVTTVPHSQHNLSERLGRLIDFGDSMRLAMLHDKLRSLQVEPDPARGAAVKDTLLRARLALVQTLVDSFAPAAPAPSAGVGRIKLPRIENGIPFAQLITFEPYYRFYAAHQRELEGRIQTLQIQVRDAAAAVSVELAQLAALDEALRDTLAVPIRQGLAVIPQLLGRRFDALRQEGAGTAADLSEEARLAIWSRPDGWLGRFLHDMQGLLLAEVELRLLPVLGLVEALNERE